MSKEISLIIWLELLCLTHKVLKYPDISLLMPFRSNVLNSLGQFDQSTNLLVEIALVGRLQLFEN